MNNLIDVPIASVTALTPERAVLVVRAILRSECGYAKLSPTVLTISGRLTIADGGIDAEVNVPPEHTIPLDCMFQPGLTGFQIKSGTTFKPWTRSAIRTELLNGEGKLCSEVERLVQRGGRYALICTGHDLTPEQRNDSRQEIAILLAEKGFEGHEDLVEVFGASQLAEFAERYPGTASLLTVDPIQEAWVLDEWRQDAHMANVFEESPEQTQLIARIRAGLQGEIKHIRILGEPGLGKTRIVLESVIDENIAPYVLYIPHGSQFGQTRLFRHLLKSGHDRPLVLVIDELLESELSDTWRHLKPRYGSLKIVSLDHGRDETHDEEIERLTAPRLTDETIKKILASRVGESRELDRWAAICEGSPRVAQAVADNLHANPDDLLKPPTTVPIWTRFLHGYSRRDETSARQIDCVCQHLALFSRFGYEAPVYAGDAATAHVIDDILRPDGIFSQRTTLTSDKGSRFLSILAEANPAAVLRLLESTVGQWSDQDLLEFSEHRQNLVWTLEKIAVWPALTVRALRVLARFAVNENADFSNNATGTLVGLFRIGPEAAATESTPEARLPAMLGLLHASGDAERRLGLRAMGAALDSHGMGFRIIGPEYQGLKERAKLWIPSTYGEWWHAKHVYFQALIDETRDWPPSLRPEVCQALLEAVEQQITTPPCTEQAFQVLSVLTEDSAMPPEKLNHFFCHWQEYGNNGEHPEIAKRLRNIERRFTRRNLASRFQRYVIDVDWMEWDGDFRERHGKPRNRAKILVDSLACRIARHPKKLSQIQHLLSPAKNAPALWHFGEQLALSDAERALLPTLTRLTLETKHQVCMHGYLSAVQRSDSNLYLSTVRSLLTTGNTAWLGATIALRSDYDDGLFVLCLDALEKRWIVPTLFEVLRFGKAIESAPPDRTGRLFLQLYGYGSQDALALLIELLDSIPFNDSYPVSSDFVLGVVSRSIPGEESRNVMRGYHWKSVCSKLVKWDESRTLPLLDTLLTEMGRTYRLTYDSDVAPLANELARADPIGAWTIVRTHLEETLPKWRGDLLHWLKGGLATFDEKDPRGAVIDLPVPEILEWIEKDPEPRAVLMAHAVPGTLDEKQGGRLTQELLSKYGQFEGVRNGISAAFHSGGWSGPTSAYLKRKRDKLRLWLAARFDSQTVQWIEAEIEHLDRSIEREEIDEERSRFE